MMCFPPSWRHLTIALAGLVVTACSDRPEDQEGKSNAGPVRPPLTASVIAANNRGVGLMGRFEYELARQAFAGLVEKHPNWLDARVNLAIATLNRQQEGDEQAALAFVEEVLQENSDHLRAHYVAGLLRLYLSSPAEALDHFRTVAERDPEDAYAAYYLGQCLAQVAEHEQALKWYRRALDLDPYLRSAYYGAFQALQRLKRRDEARELIAAYQRLGTNPRARLAEFKYTRMGRKAEVLAVGIESPKTPPRPQGPVFSKAKALSVPMESPVAWRRWQPIRPASITVAQFQEQGNVLVFVADALAGGETHNLVLTGSPGSVFAPKFDHPLARVSGVNSALWGDYDNDGRTDVYLCRRGPNQLWRQSERGTWEEVSGSSGSSGGDLDTANGAFFDADHDGDLDLFLVNADGPNELLNNNRDGTFRPLAAQQGLAGNGGASRGVIPLDLDRDRDVDLMVINDRPPHEIYLNDRLWEYRAATAFKDFRSTNILAAAAGDIDADGWPEIYTVAEDGELARWRRTVQGEYRAEILGAVGFGEGLGWAQLALLDADGDGVLDLVMATPAGWSVQRVVPEPLEPLFEIVSPSGSSLAGVTTVVLGSRSGPAMFALQARGGVSLWSPGPGRHAYLSLSLSGLEDAAHGLRSNASGIGAEVAVRTGSHWTIIDTFPSQIGPGQSHQPISVGLGGAEQADFVAIDWSDGVFQSEVALASGPLHRISETQRQLSSCPVLFAWDGGGYEFVSDFLGVGGIGYAIGPGEYASPRPWENLLLPAGSLQPRDGRLMLKITEPMEEAAYIDAARLLAYDLPSDWDLVLDERMGIAGPPPTGKTQFYRRELLPVHTENERGERVTETILRLDGRAAPVGELDERFIGRLQDEHVLTLEFAEALDHESGTPLLVADGWVEYPYSQTMFAAWQAGAAYTAPTVEARGDDGQWRTLLAEFGYPAGMPRRMSVPLGPLPKGTRALRIRSNLEVYWDRIAVAFAESLRNIRRQPLPLLVARVAKPGFPQRTTGDQRRPSFDYSQRRPFWDTRYMAGYYTQLGDVRDLVERADDAVVIIGAGEEVHLEYAAPASPPPAGWSRRYVLETRGWTKDMDLYTQHAETVEPLPTTGQPAEPRDRLHARYNTRYLVGR